MVGWKDDIKNSRKLKHLTVVGAIAVCGLPQYK